MNKKIPIGVGIALVAIVVIIVGAKAYFGDSATELPGEEKMENTLNLQESGKENVGEAGEDNEAGEAGESVKKNP